MNLFLTNNADSIFDTNLYKRSNDHLANVDVIDFSSISRWVWSDRHDYKQQLAYLLTAST